MAYVLLFCKESSFCTLHIPVLLGKDESWEGLRHFMDDIGITLAVAVGERGSQYRWIVNVFL